MKPVQIIPALSKVFRRRPGIGHRTIHGSTSRTAGDFIDGLDRILYGMEMHEQFVVRKVLSMAGQTVPVQNDTVAIGKKMTPCYLQKGTQVKISENPLSFDQQAEILINVFDGSRQDLSIRLSDYIQDIYVDSQ